MNNSEIATMVAFEGVDLNDMIKVRLLFDDMRSWGKAMDVGPECGLLANGDRTFRGEISLFQQKIFRTKKTPDELTIYTLKPNAKNDLDWSFIFSVINRRGASPVAFLGVGSSVLDIECTKVNEVAELIVDSLRPSYCYGYNRAYSSFPEGYVLGLNLATDESIAYDQKLRISRWGSAVWRERVYDRGVIRSIYPMNLLNPSQMAGIVEGVALNDWIGRNRVGKLFPFKQGLMCWTLNRDEIEFATQAMTGTEILFK